MNSNSYSSTKNVVQNSRINSDIKQESCHTRTVLKKVCHHLARKQKVVPAETNNGSTPSWPTDILLTKQCNNLMLLCVATSNNDIWSPDQILKEPSLISILPWAYVYVYRLQPSEGTRSLTLAKALDLVIICALSVISELMTRVCPYYSSVSFMPQQQRFGITGVPAGVLALRVISGLLYITEQDCLREFFGGLWETDKGLAVMLWSIWGGAGVGLDRCYKLQLAGLWHTPTLIYLFSPPTRPPHLPAVWYPVDLSWMERHLTSVLKCQQ